jgi:hypothetical protein
VEGYDYAQGDAAAAYMGPMEKFRRHVVHVRPGVYVMFDDLRAAKPAKFQWLLHAYNKIEVDEASQMLRIRNSPAAMNVQLLLPEEVSFSQTDRYEPEPESIARSWKNTWHLSASTVDAARSARFLSVFLPFREGAEDELPRLSGSRETVLWACV